MVYPRACGGTLAPELMALSAWGLSPRVRGNPPLSPVSGQTYGSIPARAGEPPARRLRGSARRVYPRACGGTGGARRVAGEVQGLSPRVRGNRTWANSSRSLRGSIPARAGEPRDLVRDELVVGVYPRACGGTDAAALLAAVSSGLSPRVRGNRHPYVPPLSQSGSIPARAGEPRCCSTSPTARWVYPRACGGTSRWLRRCR